MNTREHDLILVHRAQGGDETAFGMLVRRYQESLYLLAVSLIGSQTEAEDMAAEAFLCAWRDIANFRGDSNFKTWLWRILINRCRSHLRRRYVQRKVFFWRTAECDSDASSPESTWVDRSSAGDPQLYTERKNLQRLIQKAREGLSPREREVFSLKFDHDLKICEIGRVLSISENTIKVLLFRAARKMTQALQKYRDEL